MEGRRILALARPPIPSGRMQLVDCHETPAAAAAARLARADGIPTVVDVEEVRDGIHDLLVHTDCILAAEACPAALTGYGNPGRALAAIANEYRAPIVAVTLGDEGSLALCGGREIRRPAFPVSCIDSTGAGGGGRDAAVWPPVVVLDS